MYVCMYVCEKCMPAPSVRMRRGASERVHRVSMTKVVGPSFRYHVPGASHIAVTKHRNGHLFDPP